MSTILQYIAANKATRDFRRDGVKPTITRKRANLSMYGVTVLQHFTRIDTGKTVNYYANKSNPFHNLYRIDSRPADDFVIHKGVR